MTEIDLNDDESRLLDTIAEAESEGEPGTVQELARRTGLDLDRVEELVSGLIHKSLVREVTGVPPGDPDFGPRYEIQSRPGA